MAKKNAIDPFPYDDSLDQGQCPHQDLEVALLKRELQKLQEINDHAPIGRFLVDANGCIKWLNFSGARLLGFDREQALGRSLLDHTPEEERALVCNFIELMFLNGSAPPCEIGFNNAVGETISVTLCAHKISDESVIHLTVSEAFSIAYSDRKLATSPNKLELKVQQRTERLRNMARELTLAEERERRRIARLLHDDLQQLLVAILLNLNATKLQNHNYAIFKDMESIELMAKQCINVTRTLASDLSPPILYQSGLMAGFFWLRDWFSEKYGFNLELCTNEDLIPDEDICITLFQCVREIVFNSFKYSSVNSARLEVIFGSDSVVDIIIQDQGNGFDVDALKSQSFTSGGFGLFSVRDRLELLGGILLIESTQGQGSRFTLRLPAQVFERSKNPDSSVSPELESPSLDDTDGDFAKADGLGGDVSRAPRSTSRFRMILADDHSMVRQGLVRVFRDEADFEVVGEAVNGREAIELAREQEPDIILMDLQMPVMSGLEATRVIRRELPGVQVIGLSMDATKESRRSLLRAGALDLLHKGESAEDLIQRVRKHVAVKAAAVDG